MSFDNPSTLQIENPARSKADPVAALEAIQLDTLATSYERDTRSFWVRMRPGPKPSFTPELLADIHAQQRLLREAIEPEAGAAAEPTLKWYVFGSLVPGIFNLGGDLALFAEKIRARDEAALRAYGYRCVEVIHGNSGPFPTPVVSIAMVQGDALGGGFECALACDVIVAERGAKFGLPEVLFNLFPGMGAYSFLSRRIGTIEAERLITSGKLYTAEEMQAMGVVDVVAEDGQGEAAVRDWIDGQGRRHNALQAVYRTRRRVNPVTLQELKDVVDIWVDTALRVSESDLRKMLRLTQAQEKRLAAAVAAPSLPALRVAAE